MKSGGKWKSFDFGPELKSNSSPVKTETIINSHKATKTTFSKSFNFHKQLTPKTVDELAVHPKKIQEVQEWLKLTVLAKEIVKFPFLLLSGPTGSGKTVTLNLLCKQLGISISEWINSTDKDYEYIKGSNQITRFIEFLCDSKWNSLFEASNTRKITLIKDFPNAVIHQPEEFFNILRECSTLNSPIVFICTDASNNSINLARTLFPEDIISKYNIAHISFNICAPTLMKKAIKRAQCLAEENSDILKQPSPTIIDGILATAMGDIRNAMNQFHLASLGSDHSHTKGKVGSKRKRNDKVAPTQSMSRDENLGLFHGLGRVLNPKRKQLGNSWRISCDVEKLVDEFSIQPAVFISFLFENYLKYFGDVNDASKAAEILSLSQQFVDNWGDKHETIVFGLWISVLGLMIYNDHRVSKWNQIRGPTKTHNISNRVNETLRLHPEDYFYYNVIKGTDVFHKFTN